MLITVKEFSKMHGLPNAVANSVIQFLLTQGAIEKTDQTRRKKSGGGRNPIVFKIPEKAFVKLLKDPILVEQIKTAKEMVDA